MTRDDFFALATKHGWVRGQGLTSQQRTAISNALRGALEGPIATAFVPDPLPRPMTMDEAVANLLEELD